jgi:hypothetical protein
VRTLAAALALATVPALADPVVFDVAKEMKEAWLIAEAHILEVDSPSDDRKRNPDEIRVRITADPERIFRGHEWLGAELELKIPPDGAIQCLGLRIRIDEPEPMLVVADGDRMLVLGGYPAPGGYRMRTWADLHVGGWRLECADPLIGKPVAEGEHRGEILVDRAALARLHREEGRAFWATVAPYLTVDPSEPKARELDDLVEMLSSGSARERDDAQATLVADTRFHVLRLERALELARDPEVRRRLAAVLDRVRSAHAVAAALSLQERSRRWVVEEALPVLEGEARARAERWLAREAAAAPLNPR